MSDEQVVREQPGEQVTVDGDLLSEAVRVTSIGDKRQVVEEGLKALIRVRRQQPLRELRGKVHWDGNLDEMRIDQ